MATIGELMLRVGIDTGSLDSGLNSAIKAVDSFEGSATRAGKALDKAFSNLGVKDSSAAVAAQMKTLQNSFEFLERSFKSGKISAEDFAKAQDAIKVKLEQLSGLAAPVARQFTELGAAFKSVGVSGSQFQVGTQIADLQKNLTYLSDAYKAGKISAADFAKAQASVTAEMDKLTKVPIDKLADHLGAIGKAADGLKTAGAGLTASVTLPLVAIGAASVKMAGDFEASMNKVEAFGDITGSSLKKLEDLALELGAKTKFSAKEAADGMAELAAAGLNVNQIAATMPAVLSLAAAGEMAVGTAALTAADLMGQFDIKAEDLGHAIDLIAKAAAASSANVAQMTESFKTVGAVAHSAGLSLEDVSAAITVLAQGGRKAEQAGTDLRSVLASLLDPSKEAATAMKQLNINVKDAQGNLKPFGDVITELGKLTGHTTEIFKIFGREGATGATLFAKSSTEAFAKVRAELSTTNNDAERMAETMNKGIKGAFEKASGSIETLGIIIGKALAPATISIAGFVESSANKLAELATAFGKLPVVVQEFGLAFVGLAAAGGPALYMLGQFAGAIPNIVNAVKTFQELAASAAVMEALGTALAIATPLAIAFGVAIVGWAIYKAVTEIQQLEHEMDQLRDSLAKGGAATKAQAAEIAVLEQALKSAGKELPKAFDMNDNLKSVAQYTSELKTAVGGLDDFKGKAVAASTALKGGTIDLTAAAGAYLGLGKAIDSQKGKIAGVSTELKASGAEHETLSKKAEAAAAKAARAYEKAGEDIKKALSDLGQVGTKAIDAAINSLNILSAAYEKGKISIQQYADASVVAAKKVEDALKASYDKSIEYLHTKSLEPIVVEWDMTKLGPAVAAIIDKVNLNPPNIKVDILFPPTSLEDLKKANEDVLKLDDAMKRVGIDTSKLNETVRQTAADYKFLQEQADTGAISQKVADEAHIRNLEAIIAQMKALDMAYGANGKSLEENQKQLDVLKEKIGGVTVKAKEQTVEVSKMGAAWGKFADDVGSIMGDLASDLGKLFFTGEGSFGAIMSQGWRNLKDALVKDFVTPATDILKDFALKSLKGLIGGEGFGGVISAAKEAGQAIKAAFGIANTAINTVGAVSDVAGGISTAADVAGGAIDASGNIIKAGATAANAGATGASSVVGAAASGVMGIANVITGAVSAISGVIGNFQFAHMNTALGRIETNTREMSTVMWQTGAESLQGLAKLTYQWVMFANDRLNDLRNAILDPVARLLEEILRAVANGVTATTAITDAIEATATATADTAAAASATAISTTATADAAAATADATNATAANTANTVQAVMNASQDASAASDYVAQAITQSGADVADAVTQTTLETVAATVQGTYAIQEQIGGLGSSISNAYSDLGQSISGGFAALSGSIISSMDGVRSLSAQQIRNSSPAPGTIAPLSTIGGGITSGVTKTTTLGDYVDPSSWSKSATMPTGTQPGIAISPYVAPYVPQPYNPSSQPINLIPPLTPIASNTAPSFTFQFAGPVTNEEYQKELMRQAAEKITAATR